MPDWVVQINYRSQESKRFVGNREDWFTATQGAHPSPLEGDDLFVYPK